MIRIAKGRTALWAQAKAMRSLAFAPTDAMPGSPEKIEILAARVRANRLLKYTARFSPPEGQETLDREDLHQPGDRSDLDGMTAAPIQWTPPGRICQTVKRSARR